MDIFTSREDIIIKRPAVVALGFFDGLHIGHMELLSKCLAFANERGLPADVFTFKESPRNLLAGKFIVPRLLTEAEKLERLEEIGIDRIYNADFANSYQTVSAESFAKDFIKDFFDAEAVFCGFNFRFGAGAKGDTESLTKFGQIYGFETHIIDPVYVAGRVVSSSLIRHCINGGEVEPASRLLGRDYAMSGIVVKGNELGRGIGFPTANIHPAPEITLPARGVYVTETLIEGITYPSISNVGVNPTISDKESFRIETHLLDMDVNLYGKEIRVVFKKMIRPERRFEDMEALKRQIEKDVETTRRFFY